MQPSDEQYNQWATAINAAQGTDSSNIYQNYARAGSTPDASSAAVAGKKAAFDATNEEAARQAALAAKKVDLEQQLSAKDPSKAKMALNQDGSYSYYDGNGGKLSLNQYSLLTGQTPADILKNSDRPEDQKFVNDYNTMHAFASAWVNGDNATLQKMREADPEKFNSLISTYKTPADMVNAFRNYYSDYYGSTTNTQKQDTPAFSLQNVAGAGTDTAGKAIQSTIDGSPLSQTLAPTTLTPPKQGSDFGAWIDSLNPWGNYNTQKRAYDEQAKSNPWLAYQSYLSK